MELLYYWVSEDHTYENTGFHLSNRFNFNFKINNDELELQVKGKKEYIENFFGHHILNLTAIIGQNGTGKTNLLYSLISRLSGYQYVYGTQYILAFFNGQKIIVYESLTSNGAIKEFTIKSPMNHEIVTVENDLGFHGDPIRDELKPSGTGLIYFNPIYDFRDYPFRIDSRDFADVSSTYLLWHDGQNRNSGDYDMVAAHRSQEVLRQFRMTQSPFLKDIDVIGEISLPNLIEVEVLKTGNIDESNLGYKSKTLFNIIRNYGSIVFGTHNGKIEKTSRPSREYSKALKEKAKTWLLVNFFDHFFYCFTYEKDLDDELLELTEKNFDFFAKNQIVNQEHWNDWPSIGIDEYRSIILKFFKEQQYIDKAKFNIFENLSELLKIIDTTGEVKSDNEAIFSFPFESAFVFLEICDKYAQAFNNKYNQGFVRVQWRNLSSGELGFLNLFSRIFLGYSILVNEITEIEKIPRTIYLLIDEGEHGLHPHWQKTFIKVLISYLKFFKDLKFQILITSHSPIILSDIPKSNIIFLQKEKGGHTKVISPQDKTETFGSNIHTLFRDSFFIKDGLVGYFAKAKIKELVERIEEINDQTNTKEIDSLHQETELIGEPILKNTLKEKILNQSNDDLAIMFYEKEIERLKAKKKRR